MTDGPNNWLRLIASPRPSVDSGNTRCGDITEDPIEDARRIMPAR